MLRNIEAHISYSLPKAKSGAPLGGHTPDAALSFDAAGCLSPNPLGAWIKATVPSEALRIED